MKLRALLGKNNVALILSVILCTFSKAASASNAVCPPPVGGQVTCEDGQLAYCRVNRESGVDAGCRTPPKNLSPKETKAWTLSQVLGKEVTVDDAGKSQYTDILRTGSAAIDGSKVSFKVPSEVMEKLYKEEESPKQKTVNPEKFQDKTKPEIMKQEMQKQNQNQ